MTMTTTMISMAALLAAFSSTTSFAADAASVRAIVDAAIKPVMEQFSIPGVAVGVTVDGKTYVFDYGVASKDGGKPVTPSTLFELGSVSKTFTVTLASYAQEIGKLSLTDKTARFLPMMQGTPFGEVSLLSLATHTGGGFPLQVPDDVSTNDQLMTYLQHWKPTYAAGTKRTYANPSIGMLGFITAKSMGEDYTALLEKRLFPALGLSSSYIDVPADRDADYAQGYTRKDVPARMTPGVLDAEAYGVKSTAGDMIRMVEANMGMVKLDDTLQHAITATHTGYFDTGAMTQDLIWEQYPYPAKLQSLLSGNSDQMALQTNPVTKISPPMPPRDDVVLNKTGSTNGFGAYVAFIPKARTGIVILANKNYPNADRVKAGYEVLTKLIGTASDH